MYLRLSSLGSAKMICNNCQKEFKQKNKVVYTLEVRRQDGIYECEYHDGMQVAEDYFGVLKLLSAEVDNLIHKDISVVNHNNEVH